MELHGVRCRPSGTAGFRDGARAACEAEQVRLCIRKSQVIFLNQKTKCIVKKDVHTELAFGGL